MEKRGEIISEADRSCHLPSENAFGVIFLSMIVCYLFVSNFCMGFLRFHAIPGAWQGPISCSLYRNSEFITKKTSSAQLPGTKQASKPKLLFGFISGCMKMLCIQLR